MKIHQSRWNSFKRALYQFTMPVVSLDARGHQVRMESHPSLLSQIDSSILPELDNPQTELDTVSPPHNGLPGTRCKNIGVVPRPPYPSPLQPPPKPRQTKQKKEKAPRPSSSVRKRTRSDTSREGKERRAVQKTEYFNQLKNKCEYFSCLSQ